MGRQNRRKKQTRKNEFYLLSAATAGARTALNLALRFSEAFEKGPFKNRALSPGVVDIGWLFTDPPEGIDEEYMTPDLTVRIRFEVPTPTSVAGNVEIYYGPLLPDAAKKKEICDDVMELIRIEMTQGGGKI